MKTTKILFVRRPYGYQVVPSGVATVAKVEDAIYVTITSEDGVVIPDLSERTNASQMSNWLKELRALHCTIKATDAAGRPLPIDINGDR